TEALRSIENTTHKMTEIMRQSDSYAEFLLQGATELKDVTEKLTRIVSSKAESLSAKFEKAS
ncbi:MAG: hypothetical protein KDD45_12460, partial [Bdellovibrionales bacterium]|nr:hypothetical protein [Bdellovibrionales bacterium]